eukprot:CAMPEP_0176099592 /NCGR_PEP_ID=MMETSP0120_2-20121206/49946_1 /TAXON_ID=160619 /ORGANISM="Kryptoperidinium foliaceum, Strain CCMP 1326" /LENGTH=208 /DNA_ID=CAMNT_0017433625 /DNA_START=32 /DNA_END=659 /DNA_ORIENTATION=+
MARCVVVAVAAASAIAIVDGAYSFTGGRTTDVAWYSDEVACAEGKENTEVGGWRFYGKADFSKCLCQVGSQLSDGRYTSLHMCKTTEGGVKIQVWQGKECAEPDPYEMGVVGSAFVSRLSKASCVKGDTELTDVYFDRYWKGQEGLTVGCPCGEAIAETVDGTSAGAIKDAASRSATVGWASASLVAALVPSIADDACLRDTLAIIAA